MNTVSGAGNSSNPAGRFLADSPGGTVTSGLYSSSQPNSQLNAAAIGQAGGGQPVDIRSPYLTLNWIIALQGVYPSRS